jgi:hypothetical protein
MPKHWLVPGGIALVLAKQVHEQRFRQRFAELGVAL